MKPPDPLSDLLDALADLRRFWERPDRKRRFMAELGEPVELGVLRTLGAVAALTAPGPGTEAGTRQDDFGAAEEQGGGVPDGHDLDEPGTGAVAAALAVDVSTASRLVDQAVCAGYLLRVPGRRDRRRTRLELTAEGAALAHRAREIRRRWLTSITDGWSPEDVSQLAGLLRRFIDGAGEAADEVGAGRATMPPPGDEGGAG